MGDLNKSEGETFEQWLDEQLIGGWATGDLETELRMAVSQIRDMPKHLPKDFAVQPLKRFIEQYALTKQLEEMESIPTKLVHIKDGLGIYCGTVNALDPYYRDNRIAELRSQLTSNKSKE